MILSQAVSLIQSAPISPQPSQTWADLGAGTGTFTLALAELLPESSLIYAIDQNARALRQIPSQHKQISIEILQADFATADFQLNNLDGILMANALHYIRDKSMLISKLRTYLKANGSFLIVEYETTRANPWVPYPIQFESLQDLFTEMGFSFVEKLGEIPSRYQGKMYAAWIKK